MRPEAWDSFGGTMNKPGRTSGRRRSSAMHRACQAENENPCPVTPNRIGRELELATSPRGRHTPAHDLDPKWGIGAVVGSGTTARFVRHRHIRSSISRLPALLTRIRPTNSRPRSGLHDEWV